MSLLGRLEDLSLTDIIQIVFLSRRTGMLEIIDAAGRHTVLFDHGLLVNASSPDSPSLAEHLLRSGIVGEEQRSTLVAMEESGVAVGTAVADLNLVSDEQLAEIVVERVRSIVTPLLSSRDGEFNFILSDGLTPQDIEYEPKRLFREGGLAPQRIMPTEGGEKLKPLSGLEESMRAGKELLRSTPSPGTNISEAALEIELPRALDPSAKGEPPAAAPPTEQEEDEEYDEFPFGDVAELDSTPDLAGELDIDDRSAATADDGPEESVEEPTGFHLEGGETETEEPGDDLDLAAELAAIDQSIVEDDGPEQSRAGDAGPRTDGRMPASVVLYERNPMIRVAAKRAFGRKGTDTWQYGDLDNVRATIDDLIRGGEFFVTYLELGEDREEAIELLRSIKAARHHLPVVMIDRTADLRLRHQLLKAGADLYLTKPSYEHLQPGVIEEQLSLYADELVLFAERAFAEWHGGERAPTGSFHDIGEKERLDRSFLLLKQLINELSSRKDIGQVSLTILRLATAYLDRAVIFLPEDGAFVGLGGFGQTGDESEMDSRVRTIRIPQTDASVLAEVASSGTMHQGKMRRTEANARLLEGLGPARPTEVVVLPILDRGAVIGMLYGDNATRKQPIEAIVGLEIFLQQAGFAFHNAVVASANRELKWEE